MSLEKNGIRWHKFTLRDKDPTKSSGNPTNMELLMDGVPLPHVVSVRFEVAAQSVPRIFVEFIGQVEIETSAELTTNRDKPDVGQS